MPDLLKILRQCGQVSFGVAVGVIGLEDVDCAAVTAVGVTDLEATLDVEPDDGVGCMTLGMSRNAFPIALTLMAP